MSGWKHTFPFLLNEEGVNGEGGLVEELNVASKIQWFQLLQVKNQLLNGAMEIRSYLSSWGMELKSKSASLAVKGVTELREIVDSDSDSDSDWDSPPVESWDDEGEQVCTTRLRQRSNP